MSDILERLQGAIGDAYHIERELARGGMSQLFLATEASLNRQVVIKILPPEEASVVSAARFRQEIEVAATLQHPHILPVLSTGNQGDLIWFIMPYVRGESLRQMLDKRGPLPVDEAVDILTEVSHALAFAHERGVIHRDIKPENILIHEGHAVLTDFGVARAREQAAKAQDTRLTGMGMAIGTPGYMSPEQAAGESNIDARSDLYALAVVGYEMLTGQPPFTGPTAQSVMAAHLTATPKPVTAFRKDVPSAIVASLNKALAKSPDHRFQTGAEFSAALRGATRVRSGPSWRVMMGAGAVVVAALVVATLPRGYRAEGDPRQSLVVFPFENRTGDPSREYLEEAAMNLLGLSAAHWQDMRVFDDERTASALRRRNIANPGDLVFEDAQAIAREARVGTLVLGDLRREGDSLAIEAKVHDVRTGDRLATHIVRAAWTADPRPLFDQLADLILGTSGAPPGERPSVLAQTTTSVEAYRAYLVGTQALQRFEIDSARAALRRAVALDSTFALAYIRLRDVEGWTLGTAAPGNPETRRQLIAQAQRHSGDLPPRLRSLIAFHDAYEAGNLGAARAIVSEMIARDSTDVEAWYQLGEAHFHHNSGGMLHADTLGNVGRALRAFQRSLALDSNYILAYQHILDALRMCAVHPGLVCLADSAVYGSQEDLTRRLGAAARDRWKAAASEEQIRTARGWIAIAPTSNRPRIALITALVQQGRTTEVEQEVEAFRRAGGGAEADLWLGLANFQMHRIAEAQDPLMRAFAQGDTVALMSTASQNGGPQTLGAALGGGGGRVAAGRTILRRFMASIPLDSLFGPGNLQWPRADVTEFLEAFVLWEAGDSAAAPIVRRLLDAVDRRTAGDTAARRRTYTTLGVSVLGSAMAAHDTTLLARMMRYADTTVAATWRVVSAQLALARGDTAAARARIRQSLEPPAPSEFRGDQGIIRAFAWADVLARLGQHRRAIEVLASIDNAGDARLIRPGFEVRSWLERGALYQLVGVPDSARIMYERFVAAWDGADAAYQPIVTRARDAIRALEGQTRRVGG